MIAKQNRPKHNQMEKMHKASIKEKSTISEWYKSTVEEI